MWSSPPSTRIPPVNSLRVEAEISTFSAMRLVIYSVSALLVFVIAALAGLRLWQWLLLAMACIAIFKLITMHLSYPRVAHVTQPRLDRGLKDDWLLLVEPKRSASHQLWQAQLLRARDFGLLLVLEFRVKAFHGNVPKSKRVHLCIYQDQVTPQAWRQLKVLTNVVKS